MLFGANFKNDAVRDTPFKLSCLVTGAENLSDWVQFVTPLVGRVLVHGQFDTMKGCSSNQERDEFELQCGAGTEHHESRIKEYHLWIKRVTSKHTRYAWRCDLHLSGVTSNLFTLYVKGEYLCTCKLMYFIRKKEGNVLFNDALNTFYLRLYDDTHMVNDHAYSER